MNALLDKENKKIENLIYEVRGKQVMLDRDLANLYHTETRILIQKMKRNIERFPESFCFQMNDKEFKIWKSQNVISTEDKIGLRRAPYVFTEQGVAMLSAIIKTEVAINISIKIMDAFISMRHQLIQNQDIYKSLNHINNKLIEHDDKLNLLFSKFYNKEKTFLPGKIYDAYSEIINIFNEIEKELIIIDSYTDISLLNIIRNIECKITLITSDKTKLTTTEIDKFNKQYNKLKVIKNNTFHDRYFILDQDIIYHCGTSLNRIGTKTFSINLLEDKIIKKTLLNHINSIINNKK